MNKFMRPKNSKGQPHGYWESYWSNGNLHYKCKFHNGNAIGYE